MKNYCAWCPDTADDVVEDGGYYCFRHRTASLALVKAMSALSWRKFPRRIAWRGELWRAALELPLIEWKEFT